MKLKNKKTGEIRELSDGFFCGDNLKKICEEWEDAPEEPKEYYWVRSGLGNICNAVEGFSPHDEYRKQIGNYFKTKEEAEKAVEKLKACKRLKDMGFKIEGIRYRDNKNYIEWSISPKVRDDHFDGEAFNEVLHLLFGGEE